MPLKKVLITGAAGLLGTPTARAFSGCGAWCVTALARADLDITDDAAVQAAMERFRPDLVINCAAYTKVDACEANEAHAARVNGEGAGFVAARAAQIGARLIHISTDYVFDGRDTEPYSEEHAPGNPGDLCAYGRSKLLGERQVQSFCPSATIVRTAWLYGEDGPCFPKTILRLAKERPSLRVVNDQVGAPTYAKDLAEALLRLAAVDRPGVYHVTNAGRCSWYEFACRLLGSAGLSTPVEPITTEDFPLPARRPAFSVLDNTRFNRDVGPPLRPWHDAIVDFMRSSP